MDISDKLLDDFIEAYHKEFGEMLTREQARMTASEMVNFAEIVLGLPGAWNAYEPIRETGK